MSQLMVHLTEHLLLHRILASSINKVAPWAKPPLPPPSPLGTTDRTLSGNAASALAGSGFELRPNGTFSFSAPPGWSGRFWARTGCAFDPFSASGTCDTGDCGGALRCTVGGSPPVTLAEFTLAGPTSGDQDFYDVSLVDGYNVRVACPAEWRVTGASWETVACRRACEAFRAAEYCCTGAHSSPASCGPSRYSQLFKAACPAAYSYAYDDVTSTFTCAPGTAGYIVTFCPSSADAKSGRSAPPLPQHAVRKPARKPRRRAGPPPPRVYLADPRCFRQLVQSLTGAPTLQPLDLPPASAQQPTAPHLTTMAASRSGVAGHGLTAELLPPSSYPAWT
ncbi:hypothetical protein BHE74_00008975 [Ensete ventricosum]|nr:hypothetical protein BHE74_00008975 [Ensete ventricosum]